MGTEEYAVLFFKNTQTLKIPRKYLGISHLYVEGVEALCDLVWHRGDVIVRSLPGGPQSEALKVHPQLADVLGGLLHPVSNGGGGGGGGGVRVGESRVLHVGVVLGDGGAGGRRGEEAAHAEALKIDFVNCLYAGLCVER